MKRMICCLLLGCLFIASAGMAQTDVKRLDSVLPVRGLAIGAPSVEGLDVFIKFIEEELAPAHINLLVLRVDWNYAYKSHPELRNANPLPQSAAKRIVAACRKHGICVAPQINLLGHQSDRNHDGALLREYPQFDETPEVITANYNGWPNADGLYCKSYCPLHPDVHAVVFALIDELTEAFETDVFHAGMDEVFYIGDDKCPRCSGRDKAELFAGEVNVLHNYLAQTGRRLMIWGDRLIDGKTTGIGEWEASMNQTYRAVDLIPKDVFICDWHYDRPDQTAAYFAMKGFAVATCPWKKPWVALAELEDVIRYRKYSTPEMAERFQGIIATVWSGTSEFLNNYYDTDEAEVEAEDNEQQESEALTLKRLLAAYKKL